MTERTVDTKRTYTLEEANAAVQYGYDTAEEALMAMMKNDMDTWGALVKKGMASDEELYRAILDDRAPMPTHANAADFMDLWGQLGLEDEEDR
jgi:hypothetical protein